MKARDLFTQLGAYAALLLLACVFARSYVKLTPVAPGQKIVSAWKDGLLVSREARGVPRTPLHQKELGAPVGAVVVEEEIVGVGPLFAKPAFFAMALVAGNDGARATIGEDVAYVTADDLLRAQAYEKGFALGNLGLGYGTSRKIVVDLLAERLETTPTKILETAKLERVRFRRLTKEREDLEKIAGDTLTKELVSAAAYDAAKYLARAIDMKGRYRYTIDAATGKNVEGYNWPRHSGATFFLAQWAGRVKDPLLIQPCLNAAKLLRDVLLVKCGDMKCIAEGDEADLGASALALNAFAEIQQSGIDDSFRTVIDELSLFLRKMQRPDGEFMHTYNRKEKHPNDIQKLYYSGEATLALARAHLITKNPDDLEAARKGLAHLVGPAWSFFGSRYIGGEEHWTCQALADLWDRAPDQNALEFCLNWHRIQRQAQYRKGETPFDSDGAFGTSPFFTPRITPASSRGEAAGATLAALIKARPNDPERAALEDQYNRSLAFVMRHQFRPGPAHLFANPELVRGGFPGSPVDFQVRIDFPQHAGSSMVRWLDLHP